MFNTDIRYESFSFALLIPFSIVIFFLFFTLDRFRKKNLGKIASPNLLKEILIPRSFDLYWFKTFALSLAWVFATLALMDPIGKGHYTITEKEPRLSRAEKKETPENARQKSSTVIFLIDASDSMKATDANQGLSRFEVAKEIASDVISRLKGENAALYAFTSEMTKLSPPTMDYLFVRLNLRAMSINEGDASGTDILDALTKIRREYLSTFNATYKNLILLTDGEDNLLDDKSEEAKNKRISAMTALFDHAKENRLKTYVIGLGTKEGAEIPDLTYQGKSVHSSLNEELLKKISEAGNGKYYFAKDYPMTSLAEELIHEMARKTSSDEDYQFNKQHLALLGEKEPIYTRIFQPFLAFAIFFLGLAIFLPNTKERYR